MRELTWVWGRLGLSSFVIIGDFFKLAVVAMCRLILPFLDLLRLVNGYNTFIDDN
jgi:hypothetical protein